jgi:hypothetical protein
VHKGPYLKSFEVLGLVGWIDLQRERARKEREGGREGEKQRNRQTDRPHAQTGFVKISTAAAASTTTSPLAANRETIHI